MYGFQRQAHSTIFFSRLTRGLDSRGEDRAGMAEDLIDHHIVAGMSRDEIHSLLGAPSETYTSPHYSMRSVPESKRTLAYWIGQYMGMTVQ